MLAIREAQAAASAHPEFNSTVEFVSKTAFARPAAGSPNTGHGHNYHWFGNVESHFPDMDFTGYTDLKQQGLLFEEDSSTIFCRRYRNGIGAFT